jgi:hypothetical protein
LKDNMLPQLLSLLPPAADAPLLLPVADATYGCLLLPPLVPLLPLLLAAAAST